jgi:hypothetical protein
MSSTAVDERPRVRSEANRETLIEATAQIRLDEGHLDAEPQKALNARTFCSVSSA